MFSSILETVITITAKSATRAIDNAALRRKRKAERKLTKSFAGLIKSVSK